MPIVEIQLVQQSTLRDGLAKELADAIGDVLNAGPQSTWVKLCKLDSSHYAENGDDGDVPTEPVFVSVLRRNVPNSEEFAREVQNLTHTIAALCGRLPEHVHIIYEPPASGRVAFGGEIVRP